MLGFRPDRSTLENLLHGEQLLRECDHGSILQLQNWWQDPTTYYAFESKAGARWFAKHGGPKRFMKMVEQCVPKKTRPPLADPFAVELFCHSCSKIFDSTKKRHVVQICRCICGTKVTHEECYMPETCVFCNVKFSKVVREENLLRINA
tara:strand:+ start:1412 stop:1858 length:447 start_codon:yes stop_codon:yes gene_type:complete